MTELSSRKALTEALAAAQAELARIGMLAEARLEAADPDQTLASVLALTRIGGMLATIGYALIELLPEDQRHVPRPRDPGFPSP